MFERGRWPCPRAAAVFFSGARESAKTLVSILPESAQLTEIRRWGHNASHKGISPHITSLGNYFVTSDGKDLLAVLAQAFSEAATKRMDAVIH